ncbi:MAG: TolC family protein, partial [Desulfobacterales bacterium]|nr:TolC family protein [Desulfobacterales bacterium]
MTKALPAICKSLLPAAVFLVFTTGFSCAGFAKEALWTAPALQQLINEALENNRLLQSKADRAEALKNRIAAAGALPDPKIGFALQSIPTDSFAFDQEPMTQKQIFVEQTVPWLSKLDLRSEAAAADAREKQAELEAARLELARDVALAWYELGYVTESQRINDELTELMARIRRDAQTRYGVGGGLQQDIYQAGVELSRLKDEAVRLETRKTTIEDRLHELTNRDKPASIDPPADLPEPGVMLSADKLAAAALEKNPELKGMQARIQTARAQKQLAQKDYYPDFNIR